MREMRVWPKALLCGIALSLTHLLLLLCLQPDYTWTAAYKRFTRWDGQHYRNVVERGYYSTLPPSPEDDALRGRFYTGRTNIAFFPGYPVAAMLTRAVTGVSSWVALVVTSLLGSIAFWAFFVAFLLRRGLRLRTTLLAALAVMAYPASFYLLMAYSESLFLAAMMGFMLWGERAGVASAAGSAVSGMLMTATRMFGIMALPYPLVHAWFTARSKAGIVRALCIGALGSLGTVGFFLYTKLWFGHWDVYQRSQQEGWGVHPDLLALLHPLRLLDPWVPGSLNNHSHLALALFALFFAVMVIAECAYQARTKDATWRSRIALYITSLFLLLVAMAALAHQDMQSMIRYVLGSHVPLVLAGTLFFSRVSISSVWLRGALWSAFIALFLFGAYWHVTLFQRFIDGGWVA